jgi:hypothetical protein
MQAKGRIYDNAKVCAEAFARGCGFDPDRLTEEIEASLAEIARLNEGFNADPPTATTGMLASEKAYRSCLSDQLAMALRKRGQITVVPTYGKYNGRMA